MFTRTAADAPSDEQVDVATIRQDRTMRNAGRVAVSELALVSVALLILLVALLGSLS